MLQARILEWVDISYFRGSSWPRDWTHVRSTKHFTLSLSQAIRREMGYTKGLEKERKAAAPLAVTLGAQTLISHILGGFSTAIAALGLNKPPLTSPPKSCYILKWSSIPFLSMNDSRYPVSSGLNQESIEEPGANLCVLNMCTKHVRSQLPLQRLGEKFSPIIPVAVGMEVYQSNENLFGKE